MPSYTMPLILMANTSATTTAEFLSGPWTFNGTYSNVTFIDDDYNGLGDDAPNTETGFNAIVSHVDGSSAHPLVGDPIFMSYVRTDDGDGDTDDNADVVFLTSGIGPTMFGIVPFPGSGWNMSAGQTYVNGGFPNGNLLEGSWSTEGFPDGKIFVESQCPVYDAIMYEGNMVLGSDNLSVADGELIQVNEPLNFNVSTPGQIGFGDTVMIGGTVWEVTNTATQLITLNYDTGASSGNEIGHVIELFNGTDYITYITPEDGTDYGNIISIDTNLVSGFGPVDCSDVDTNDYVTLVPPPGACLVYDFVKTNSAMPNFGDDVTVVDGEILGVEEPLWFSGGDASLIEVGDQMSSGGTTYDVTGVEAHSMEITYNDGADTTTIPMLAVEVFDGAETFTYYVPVDGTNYPDITEMEVVGELDVGDFSGKKLYDENDDVTIICFAKGSRITTITGPVAVENLDIGDRVLTADNGFQEVRWIGKRTVSGRHQFAPIKICKGTFGAERDLYVSPQHRVLIKDWRNDVILGTSEALVAAKHLVDGETIVTDTCEEVTYFHVLFDAHEIIFSEGLASESFHPGQDAVAGLAKEAREELFTLFPELASDPSDFGGSARVTMKKHEVAALFH